MSNYRRGGGYGRRNPNWGNRPNRGRVRASETKHVAILHGLLGNAKRNLQLKYEFEKRGYRVTMVEYERNFNKSQDSAIRKQVGDADIIVGHSRGGMIATRLFKDDRNRQVISVNSPMVNSRKVLDIASRGDIINPTGYVFSDYYTEGDGHSSNPHAQFIASQFADLSNSSYNWRNTDYLSRHYIEGVEK